MINTAEADAVQTERRYVLCRLEKIYADTGKRKI